MFYIKEKNLYYEGEWLSGRPNGVGKVFLPNGAYFEGAFKDGKAEGKDGLLIYPDGSYYRGDVSDSRLNGFG